MSATSEKSLDTKPAQLKKPESENDSCEVKIARGAIPPHKRVIFHIQFASKDRIVEED